MRNEQAVEFYNLINGLAPEKQSHQELAQVKTLRNMKEWANRHAEKIQDIRDKHCAKYDKGGVKILLQEKLKRTNSKDGVENSEEFLANCYTEEGKKAMEEEIRAYQKEESLPFEIYSTPDVHGLTAYQIEVLKEYKFMEEQEKKIKELKGEG